jgi:hypothetical protein
MAAPAEMDVLPGVAPVSLLLARSGETVVAVTGIRAYPTGFGFTLNLRLRNLDPRERRGFWPFPEFGYHGRRTVPADAFRLTIQFADGRSVINLDPAASDPEVPASERPMMSSGREPAWWAAAHHRIPGAGTWTTGSGPCLRPGS